MTFEAEIIKWLQQFSTPTTDYFMAFFSYFGDFIIVLVLFCVLFLNKERMLSFYFLITVGISTAVQILLKEIVSRQRPYVQYEEIRGIFNASGTSFPSGHSITSMCVVIFVLFWLYRTNPTKAQKVLSYILCGLYLVWNGVNRMYLGQHFLTDILAGYTIELLIGFFAYLCLAKFSNLYNKIERSVVKLFNCKN